MKNLQITKWLPLIQITNKKAIIAMKINRAAFSTANKEIGIYNSFVRSSTVS